MNHTLPASDMPRKAMWWAGVTRWEGGKVWQEPGEASSILRARQSRQQCFGLHEVIVAQCDPKLGCHIVIRKNLPAILVRVIAALNRPVAILPALARK